MDADATGANDGSSWVNAFNYLQDALAAAQSSPKPVEVRVAAGIYKADEGANQRPGNREATFQLLNGVTLKGAYAGNGQTHPDDRNINEYQTILSSDLAGNDVEVAHPSGLPTEPTRKTAKSVVRLNTYFTSGPLA